MEEQNEQAVEINLPPVETTQTTTEEQLAATEREATENKNIHFETALAAFRKHAENRLKIENAKKK